MHSTGLRGLDAETSYRLIVMAYSSRSSLDLLSLDYCRLVRANTYTASDEVVGYKLNGFVHTFEGLFDDFVAYLDSSPHCFSWRSSLSYWLTPCSRIHPHLHNWRTLSAECYLWIVYQFYWAILWHINCLFFFFPAHHLLFRDPKSSYRHSLILNILYCSKIISAKIFTALWVGRLLVWILLSWTYRSNQISGKMIAYFVNVFEAIGSLAAVN